MLARWVARITTGDLPSRPIAFALFAVWLCLEVILVRHHAFWRDEVRALSLATQGDLVSMIESLRGEGHPALWYLLLRGGYFLAGSPAVLWIISLGIAAAAALLLVLRAPFGWPLLALLLLSRVFIFEYSVMARNYGIGMLLMFLFAACYRTYRDRAMVLGFLLFLLANTHVLCALLVGAFLLFWSIDVVIRHGVRWTAPVKTFLLNATIAAVGVIVCFITVYPPSADLIPAGLQKSIEFKQIASAVIEPSRNFEVLSGLRYWEMMGLGQFGTIVMSLVLVGSTFGLVRSPGAFIAALGSLIGFSLFFVIVYPDHYRQEALWFIFLVTMYWIVHKGGAPSDHPRLVSRPMLWASRFGLILMVLLVTAQFMGGLRAVADLYENVQQSRSRDLSQLIKSRPDLNNAVIIADPDYLLEALPYYIDNPLCFMRERKFGKVVSFTRAAQLNLTLDDVLNVAKQLNQEGGRPVIILMAQRLDPAQSAVTYQESYNWSLSVTSEQLRRFLASAQLLARFAPARSDESYDVYLLDQSR